MFTRIYRNGKPLPFRTPRRQQTVALEGPLTLNGSKGLLWQFKQTPDGLWYMASVFMNEAKESIVDRNIDLIADTLKCALVSSTYVANADHQFIDEGGASDVVDALIGSAQTLASKATGKDNTGDFAYFDAADVTFTAVASGSIVAAVIYKDTGTATTSKIIAYSDIPDVTANGGDITIQWAAPASGAILKLA